jgi:hypothetical protein
MKITKWTLIMGLISGLLGLLGCNTKQKTKPTFEEQLNTFKELGFDLNPEVRPSDIDQWKASYKNFDEPTYQWIYQTLGSIIEREPWTPVTNKCWDFDMEAIEDHGAYVEIMENISRITNGELVFENLQDYVDLEEGKAWVSFTCNRDSYKWDLKVDNDWADGDLFDKVQALTDKYRTKGKFTYFDTGGQDFVLGFHTAEELQKIKQTTGLNIVILKARGQVY